jgi:hypothetical protein
MVNVYPSETGDYFQRVIVDGSWPTTAVVAHEIYEGFRPQTSEDSELMAVDHREEVIAEKRVTLPREQATVGSFLRLMTEKHFDRSLNPETAGTARAD